MWVAPIIIMHSLLDSARRLTPPPHHTIMQHNANQNTVDTVADTEVVQAATCLKRASRSTNKTPRAAAAIPPPWPSNQSSLAWLGGGR